MSAKVAPAPQPSTPTVLSEILAEKGIGSDMAPEDEDENVEKKEEFKEQPAPGSGLSQHLKTVIRWNIDGLYQAKARRLLKKTTKNKGILDRNKAWEAVVYGEAIPGSNFK